MLISCFAGWRKKKGRGAGSTVSTNWRRWKSSMCLFPLCWTSGDTLLTKVVINRVRAFVHAAKGCRLFSDGFASAAGLLHSVRARPSPKVYLFLYIVYPSCINQAAFSYFIA